MTAERAWGKVLFESSQRMTNIPASGMTIPPGKRNEAAVFNRWRSTGIALQVTKYATSRARTLNVIK